MVRLPLLAVLVGTGTGVGKQREEGCGEKCWRRDTGQGEASCSPGAMAVLRSSRWSGKESSVSLLGGGGSHPGKKEPPPGHPHAGLLYFVMPPDKEPQTHCYPNSVVTHPVTLGDQGTIRPILKPRKVE